MTGPGRDDDSNTEATVSKTPPSDDLSFEEAIDEQEDAEPPR
ncbi:hypothetical protein BH09ACT2_BH09ACT2_19540 [soil metagenome]